MKLLVDTTGEFQIFGLGEDQWARHDRTSVVVGSQFIQNHLAGGRLKVVGQVTDEATDALLEEALGTETDAEKVAAIIADFIKTFAPEEEKPAKAPAKAEK